MPYPSRLCAKPAGPQPRSVVLVAQGGDATGSLDGLGVGRVAVMSGLAQRPFVFLDVDGPLIPFRARSLSGRRSGDAEADLGTASGSPVLDRLDPQDGRRLLALDCPLVWATSWMGEANEVVAPRLGLPSRSAGRGTAGRRRSASARAALEDDVPHRMGGRPPLRVARRRGHRRGSPMGRRTASSTCTAAPSRSIRGLDGSGLRADSTMARSQLRRHALITFTLMPPTELAGCAD